MQGNENYIEPSSEKQVRRAIQDLQIASDWQSQELALELLDVFCGQAFFLSDPEDDEDDYEVPDDLRKDLQEALCSLLENDSTDLRIVDKALGFLCEHPYFKLSRLVRVVVDASTSQERLELWAQQRCAI
jgi:hypothetical protein